MHYTASDLRQDIYRILDRILETGVPAEVVRRGRVLRIVPTEPRSKLGNLVRRPLLNCDPESIIHIDWSREWRP